MAGGGVASGGDGATAGAVVSGPVTARDTVHVLITAYLVTVPTLAWLAAVGGLLWVLGAVWGRVAEGVLTWLRVWGDDLAGAVIGAAYVLAGAVCVALMPIMELPRRGGRC